MRKKTGFLCLLFLGNLAFGQQEKPCTDSLAQKTKGKWIRRSENIGSVTPAQKQEIYRRLDILHNILLNIYPDPVGVDIRETRSAGVGYFGATRTYYKKEDETIYFDYAKLLPIKSYGYFANFSPHYCAHTDKGIVFMPGASNENSDGISIHVNDLSQLAGSPAADDDWTINGLPIYLFSPESGEQWKGFRTYGDNRLHGRHLLIHREGALPYIPVTRKKYLDRCILVNSRIYDQMIELTGKMPVRSLAEQEAEKKANLAKFEKDFGKDPKRLKSAVDYYLSGYKTDQQQRDEQIALLQKNKDTELKAFRDEMEKSTREGSLDKPARVLVMYIPNPVFETDPSKGMMLITENPDYFRKELPAHVPQFLVLNWKWNPESYPAQKPYDKLFRESFPFERLKAMIDK